MISIDKYRVSANITEYYIVSKSIFLRLILMIIRKLIYVKMFIKLLKINTIKIYVRT